MKTAADLKEFIDVFKSDISENNTLQVSMIRKGGHIYCCKSFSCSKIPSNLLYPLSTKLRSGCIKCACNYKIITEVDVNIKESNFKNFFTQK